MGKFLNIGSGKPIKIKQIINLVLKKVGSGQPKIGKLNYKKGTNKNNFPSIFKAKKNLSGDQK